MPGVTPGSALAAQTPPTGGLLAPWIARLTGFAALAALGALEWQRMIGGLSSGRALLWLLHVVEERFGVADVTYTERDVEYELAM